MKVCGIGNSCYAFVQIALLMTKLNSLNVFLFKICKLLYKSKYLTLIFFCELDRYLTNLLV